MNRPRDSQRKKKNCRIVDFAVSAEHRVKVKENEKKNWHLDLPRE